MLRTLLLFLLLPFLGCAQKKEVLLQDYHFLVTDGEVSTLRQSNDTLYELHSSDYSPSMVQQHYKIISSQKINEFTILKLEGLDTISMTTDPYPATRYSVSFFKDIDPTKLGYLETVIHGLTKEGLDTVHVDEKSLNNLFFFTYYSDTYLKELSGLKKVTTKEQALEIMEAMKSDQFKLLAEKYAKNPPGDLYGSGLVAEILSKACIEKGYSPIGAGQAINQLLR